MVDLNLFSRPHLNGIGSKRVSIQSHVDWFSSEPRSNAEVSSSAGTPEEKAGLGLGPSEHPNRERLKQKGDSPSQHWGKMASPPPAA